MNKKNKNKNKKERKLKEKESEQEQEKECLICLEYKYDNEIPIKLNESEYYTKLCDCNSLVHNFCLNKWYSVSYNCPICRTNIYEDINQNIDINIDTNTNTNIIIINNTYLSIPNNFLRIITRLNKKIVLFLLFSIWYVFFYNINNKDYADYI